MTTKKKEMTMVTVNVYGWDSSVAARKGFTARSKGADEAASWMADFAAKWPSATMRATRWILTAGQDPHGTPYAEERGPYFLAAPDEDFPLPALVRI